MTESAERRLTLRRAGSREVRTLQTINDTKHPSVYDIACAGTLLSSISHRRFNPSLFCS